MTDVKEGRTENKGFRKKIRFQGGKIMIIGLDS